MFIPFDEVNDGEGETWTFWLQLDGNEAEIEKFRSKLDELADYFEAIGADMDYALGRELDGEVVTESGFVVDKLVRYAHDGYMAQHTKIVGKFTCPPDLEAPDLDGELYRGGISTFFEPGI